MDRQGSRQYGGEINTRMKIMRAGKDNHTRCSKMENGDPASRPPMCWQARERKAKVQG